MDRSISIVEYKTQQAAFFLRQLASCGYDMFAAQCYTDAFAASARSVTLALQAVVGRVEGFSQWYSERQDALRQNRLSRFFVKYRNVSSKIGETIVRARKSYRGPDGEQIVLHYFLPITDLPDVPEEDVVTVCRRQMSTLLGLVYNAMSKFRYDLDDRWHFTAENFSKMGKTFRDAVTELGFPPSGPMPAKCLTNLIDGGF